MRSTRFFVRIAYIEVAGGDHGSVISGSMPDIFKFFATHSKPAR